MAGGVMIFDGGTVVDAPAASPPPPLPASAPPPVFTPAPVAVVASAPPPPVAAPAPVAPAPIDVSDVFGRAAARAEPAAPTVYPAVEPVALPPAAPPSPAAPALAPPPTLPPATLVAPGYAPSTPILPPGNVYFDVGDGTLINPASGQPVSSPPTPEVPPTILPDMDDFEQAQADALANEPDLTDLPPWELEDPFALQFDALANPPLKGGGAADAIGQACSDYGVDPLACFANALHEGSGGGIGDTGTAYGPFQIHATDGRLPQFKGRGPSSTAVNAWAWSENGLRYAVRSMVNGKPSARGLRGHAAVYAIVYGFERPGDERRQYDLRAAEYDHLAALGAGWAAYVASKLAGPIAGGATDTKPIGKQAPAVPVYVPAGVNAQWRNLLDVFSGSVPREHAKLQSFGLTLTEEFK